MQTSTTPTDCPTAETLRRFVADQASTMEVEEIERHLEQCSLCVQVIDQLERNGVGQMIRRKTATISSVSPSQESFIGLLADPERIERLPLPEFAVPERIDKYEILEVLGSGGMGTVLKARHVHLKRDAAIKLVKGTRRFDAHAIARFSQEIEAIGKLDHANIVRAYDAGVNEDGQPYLVMELLQGRDVETLIKRRGPLSPDDACKLIRQAATALVQVHQAGLVHRDIKPSNLFVTKTGGVKLLDLGLARLYANDEPESQIDTSTDDGSNSDTHDGTTAGPLTSRLSVVGSPYFIAPEQIEQSNAVTYRADIYSLGCMLYYLLTGRPPYLGSQAEVLAAHLEGNFPSVAEHRPDVPQTLEKLIDLMTVRNPNDRIGSAKEIVDVLDKLKESSKPKPPIVVTPPLLPPPVQSNVERKTSRVMLFAVGVIVFVTLGGIVLFGFSSRPSETSLEPKPEAPQVITVVDEFEKHDAVKPLELNPVVVEAVQQVEPPKPVEPTPVVSVAQPVVEKPVPPPREKPPEKKSVPTPVAKPKPSVEVAKPVKVEPKNDPKNIPLNKEFWNKAMSGKASFDYESNSGRFAVGEGEYMFETCWSTRGADNIYVLSNSRSVAAVALVPGFGSPKRITKASMLDYSSYYRTIKVGEQAVLRNQHGKYAVVQVNRVVNRDRVPAPRSLLEFTYYILPDGDDFSKAK